MNSTGGKEEGMTNKESRMPKCPGGKVRSKGKGRGLGRGKGKGPVGRPSGS